MEFREGRVDLCSFHKLSQPLGCGTHVCLCGQGEGVGSIPGSGQALLLGAGGFLSTPSQPWFIPPSLSLPPSGSTAALGLPQEALRGYPEFAEELNEGSCLPIEQGGCGPG